MKGEDLLDAMGQIGDQYLTQSEETAVPRTRRTLWRITLVAAIVALMTACAAVAGFGVSDGKIQLVDSSMGGNGYDVWLEMEINPSAPNEILQFYQPMDCQIEGRFKTREPIIDRIIYEIIYYELRGTRDPLSLGVVRFTQLAAGADTGGIAHGGIGTPINAPVRTQMLTIGEIPMYEVNMPRSNDGRSERPGFRTFYWTDGDYLFTLEVPYDFTDEQVTKIVGSIAAVDAPMALSSE